MSRKKKEEKPPPPDPAIKLAPLGIEPNEKVRYRLVEGGRWKDATVISVESDGSVRISDGDRRVRSIAPTNIERSTKGPRNGTIWTPLTQPV